MWAQRTYEPNIDGERTWNLADRFCEGIHELSRTIDECLRIKDLAAADILLRRIENRIEYLILKKPDKMIFDKTYKSWFNDLNDLFNKVHQLLSGKNTEINFGVIKLELNKVDKILYYFLWDLNLIFPEDKYKTWEQELEEEFE